MLSRFAATVRAATTQRVHLGASSSLPCPSQYARPMCRFFVHAVDTHSDADEMLSADEFRREHEINVAASCPDPYQRFDDAGLSPQLLKVIERQGFPAPTPIQAQSWPIAKANKDNVSVAKTGSGKTLGFLVPAVEMILQHKSGEGRTHRGRSDPAQPSAIVLAPTRELAQQIHAEAEKICRPLGLNSVVLFGGASKGVQMGQLRRNPEIVIATPGRLNDFMSDQSGFPAVIDVSNTFYCVLDEADRMLDMGFEPQIKDILDRCPPPGERQTLMFTATWPKKVQAVARNFTGREVEHVMIGNADQKLTASATIKQNIHIMRGDEKQERLAEILKAVDRSEQVMIFSSTKRMCDEIEWYLRREGVRMAGVLHGNKSQTERDRVLTRFRRNEGQVMVATDVAARGIDVPNVKVVVVYDFPKNTEDYIHRIGRTGRAGKEGVAHTFLTQDAASQTPELAQILVDSGNEVSPELQKIVDAQRAPVWSQRTSQRSGGQRSGGGQRRPGYNNGSRFGGQNQYRSSSSPRGGYGEGNNRYGGGYQSRNSGGRSNYGGYGEDRYGGGGNNRQGGGYQSKYGKSNYSDDWDF